jgi:hypothetical protein
MAWVPNPVRKVPLSFNNWNSSSWEGAWTYTRVIKSFWNKGNERAKYAKRPRHQQRQHTDTQTHTDTQITAQKLFKQATDVQRPLWAQMLPPKKHSGIPTKRAVSHHFAPHHTTPPTHHHSIGMLLCSNRCTDVRGGGVPFRGPRFQQF